MTRPCGSPFLFGGTAVVTALLALLALLIIGCAPRARPVMMMRATNAHFDLPSDDGLLVSLPLRDRTTVIDAWAPSCVPCRDAVPALVARSTEIEAAGGKLVLVAVLAEGESVEGARQTLTSWGVSSPFLVDRGDVLRREAGISSLPATILFAGAGAMWVAPTASSADDVVAALRDSSR